MADSNKTHVYPNLSILAHEINQYRYHVKNELSQERFKENISIVREILRKLFYPNNEELIDLLSYDAYKFFIESENDIVSLKSCDGFLDLYVNNKGNDCLFQHGFLTRYHNVEGIYQGSLNVSYVTDDGNYVEKMFKFVSDPKDGNKLLINCNIDGYMYLEIIYYNEGKLQYNIIGPTLGMITSASNLDESIINHITTYKKEKEKVLFPEVFNKEYFKDYNATSRTRK